MPKATAGPEIERLIQLLARLPGLGPRSARRAALHLIKKRDQLMMPLAGALQTATEKVEVCRTCSWNHLVLSYVTGDGAPPDRAGRPDRGRRTAAE